MVGIYKITNLKDRPYIGQSIDILYRWEKGYKKLKCKSQPKIYNSLKKYGVENHKFEIICECEIEELDYLETLYKKFYLNKLGGWDEVLFCGLHDKNSGPKSEIWKQNIGIANKGKPKPKGFNLGYKPSEETRKKISLSKMGVKPSQETKNKMSKAHLGKKKSKTHCENIGKAKKGNKNRIGCKHSDEGKKLISIKNSKPKPEGFGGVIRDIKLGKNVMKTRKKVNQYSIEGKFIKQWSGAVEAEEFFLEKKSNSDRIGRICRNKNFSIAYGFRWKFSKDEIK